MRAPSGVRIAEDAPVVIPITTRVGAAVITLRTRYAAEGFRSLVPRDLWVEVVGHTDASLTDAVNAYGAGASSILPVLAAVTNAPIEDLDIHLAFDATDGEYEHEFFEHFLPDETGAPRHGRTIPTQEALAVLCAVDSSADRGRLLRACAFYAEALQHLRPGRETSLVLFLWMAVEALTKVAIRQACATGGCSEEELAARWGLARPGAEDAAPQSAKPALDGEARRRLIFHGDGECQRLTAAASDAFEYGSRNLETVRNLAIRALDKGAASHVRRGIVECLGLEARTLETLTSQQYDKPRARWRFTKYARGTFIGPADQLAAEDQQYPALRWEGRIREMRETARGVYALAADETLTPVSGARVSFRLGSFDTWGPDNDLTDSG